MSFLQWGCRHKQMRKQQTQQTIDVGAAGDRSEEKRVERRRGEADKQRAVAEALTKTLYGPTRLGTRGDMSFEDLLSRRQWHVGDRWGRRSSTTLKEKENERMVVRILNNISLLYLYTRTPTYIVSMLPCITPVYMW